MSGVRTIWACTLLGPSPSGVWAGRARRRVHCRRAHEPGSVRLRRHDHEGRLLEAVSPLAVGPGRKALAYAALFPVGVGYYVRLVCGSTARPCSRISHFGARTLRSCSALAGNTPSTSCQAPCVHEHSSGSSWHQRQGDDVVVVSGSLSVYVRPWCEANGIRCIATELDECKGRLTGRYRHGECTGMEKARRISSQFDLSRYLSRCTPTATPAAKYRDARPRAWKYYRWKEISAPLDTAGAVRGSDVGRDAASI